MGTPDIVVQSRGRRVTIGLDAIIASCSAPLEPLQSQMLGMAIKEGLSLADVPIALVGKRAGEEDVVAPLSVMMLCGRHLLVDMYKGRVWIPLVPPSLASSGPIRPVSIPSNRATAGTTANINSTWPIEDVYEDNPSQGSWDIEVPEGAIRPATATPSDKGGGVGRQRPCRTEGAGRPATAAPSDHSGSPKKRYRNGY